VRKRKRERGREGEEREGERESQRETERKAETERHRESESKQERDGVRKMEREEGRGEREERRGREGEGEREREGERRRDRIIHSLSLCTQLACESPRFSCVCLPCTTGTGILQTNALMSTCLCIMGSNPGPHICVASALPTEPSPNP